MIVCLVFVFSSLIEFAFVNVLSRRQPGRRRGPASARGQPAAAANATTPATAAVTAPTTASTVQPAHGVGSSHVSKQAVCTGRFCSARTVRPNRAARVWCLQDLKNIILGHVAPVDPRTIPSNVDRMYMTTTVSFGLSFYSFSLLQRLTNFANRFKRYTEEYSVRA